MEKDVIKPLSGAPVLTVSAPPHWHCGTTLKGYMVETIIALVPAVVLGSVIFGLSALRVVALACATAVVVEALCQRLMQRTVEVDDFSALLTGLLFSLMLPAAAPWWMVMVGATASIVLGKMIFGGLGGHPLCPPVVGWCVLKLSWPTLLNPDATMLATELVNPITSLKYFGLHSVAGLNQMDLLMGLQLGPLGTVHVLGLAAGGSYLLVRGYIRWYIPASFLAGVFLVAGIFHLMDPAAYATPVFHVLTGSTVFGAFFLATDCASSPVQRLAMVLFGLLAGGMVVIIRIYGIYPDGVPFAILLANLFTPLLDRIKPKPFGAR